MTEVTEEADIRAIRKALDYVNSGDPRMVEEGETARDEAILALERIAEVLGVKIGEDNE